MALKRILNIPPVDVKHIVDLKNKLSQIINSPVTTFLNNLFGGAIVLNASDIHLEPEEKKVKVRLRIDGILQDLMYIPKDHQKKITSRIKLISGIKLNITERPQDGRFSIVYEGKEIEARVSTLPSQYGESIVIRILNPQKLFNLEELGLRKEDFNLIEEILKKPNGMIIVTGPTGSGKTTTLYAFLRKIKRPEIKIITIEDPIEYKIEGVSQTQVDPEKGYDFSSGLKSIVRQDPDVILVGEIRDSETAKIAIQAALTGHLVLTTLHTSDAAGVIARILSFGEKASNIAPALNLVIGQRLVRKICSHCKKERKITSEEEKLLKKNIGHLKKINSNIIVAEGAGCEYCNFTGYKGRMGIFELFYLDDDLKEFITHSPSIISLKKKLKEKGMITMYQDGLLKVLEKETTFKEIERVLGEE